MFQVPLWRTAVAAFSVSRQPKFLRGDLIKVRTNECEVKVLLEVGADELVGNTNRGDFFVEEAETTNKVDTRGGNDGNFDAALCKVDRSCAGRHVSNGGLRVGRTRQ